MGSRRSAKALVPRVLKHTLNRLTTRMARAGVGPFSLVEHVGRKSGRAYQTPVLLARTDDGFIAELTYGDKVDWYRNIVAARGCTIRHRGQRYRITRIEPCSTENGRAAYGKAPELVLKLLGRKEFRKLHAE